MPLLIGLLSINVKADSIYFPDGDEMMAYQYFISKGVSNTRTLVFDSSNRQYYKGTDINGNVLIVKNYDFGYVQYPYISGDYRTIGGYDNNSRLFWDKSEPMYMEFYISKQLNTGAIAMYAENGTRKNVEVITYDYIAGNANTFHYVLKFTPPGNYYSLDLNFWAGGNDIWVCPIFLKYERQLTNDQRISCGLPTKESEVIKQQITQDKEQFERTFNEMRNNHREQMDTSKVTEVNGIADSLQKVGNEKTKSLLYPVQWAIDTAHNLASAPSTGIISIPVIFGSGNFNIDLTVLERNVPSVWSFIQNFIRFIVSIGIIRGILALFKGVDG